jgi:hypothetical protein
MSGDNAPDWEQSRNTANAVAAQYANKITVFFRFGPDAGPTGGGFSSNSYNFVVMPGFSVTQVCGHQNLGLLAHELGHYMGLSHTFPLDGFDSVAEAQTYFDNNGNNPQSFDGDGLADTLPDPNVGTEVFQCRHTTSLTLNGYQFILPRNNIMSYYDEFRKMITPQQIYFVHQTLLARAQNNGLSID